MASLDLLQRYYSQVWESPGWQEFRRYRKVWDDLIRRRAPQVLNPQAAEFLQATNTAVDIQSPDIEKDLHDRVAVLLSNAPRIDTISLDQGTTAKEDVEDIRIWTAGSWLQQDDGRRITRHMYEQMARYGVAVERKLWAMPTEPEGSEDREKYYAEQTGHCFGRVAVSPFEVAWYPLDEPEIYVQESIVSYPEAQRLENQAGERLRLDKDGQVFFYGLNEPVEQYQSTIAWDMRKVRVTTVAYRDEDGRWQMCVYARGENSKLEDAKELEEYVCPFDKGPYFIAPGGDELVTETNPHLRYRPPIYPLIVDCQELNALVTLLVMTAVWHIQNPFYVRLDGARPELLSAIEGLQDSGFGVVEGSGAERKFIFRTPEAGTGEVMATPRLEQMPNANLPEAFMVRLQQVQANIDFHRSNRYLTGEAFGETKAQPATSTLNQVEAAATPFGGYLTNGDTMIKDWLLAEHQALRFWDEGSDKDTVKPYPRPVRGDEPVAREPREAGEVVTLTAEKLKRPYVLTVTTKNETQAERAMAEQMADIAYEKGAITKEQWLKARGSFDPKKQEEELWKDEMARLADAEFQQVLMQSYRSLFGALTGLNQMLMQPPQTNGAAPAGPVPTGTQNGGTPLLARPQMSPAPVEGPQGQPSGALSEVAM